MHAQVVDVVVVAALQVLAVSQVKNPSLAIVSVAAAEIRRVLGRAGALFFAQQASDLRSVCPRLRPPPQASLRARRELSAQ
jgi:hypothetical protein